MRVERRVRGSNESQAVKPSRERDSVEERWAGGCQGVDRVSCEKTSLIRSKVKAKRAAKVGTAGLRRDTEGTKRR